MRTKVFLEKKNVAGHDLKIFACNSGRIGLEDTEDDEFLFWLGSKLSAKMKPLYDAAKYQEILDYLVASCEVKYFESDDETGFAGYYAYEVVANGGIVRWDGE